MTDIATHLTHRYDNAAPRWGDKMRALGYFDAYLGFLAEPSDRLGSAVRVVDVGSGTGAFAEAWVAIHGAPHEMTLLDPSAAMLERGHAALLGRGVAAQQVMALLGEAELPPADVVLAAHVIEHCPDPLTALRQMRTLLRPGGRLHLVVSKPHWCNAIIWLQWRHRTFQDADILALLPSAGFALERVYAFPSGPPSRTSRGFVAIRKE